MYCKYCGSKLSDDSSFCSSCGARVSDENQQVVKVERIYVENRTPEQIKYDSERGPWKNFARLGKNFGITSACIPVYGIILMPIGMVFSSLGLRSQCNKKYAITGMCFSFASITNLLIIILIALLSA